MPATTDDPRVRLDKWLWAARFFKTRSLAGEEIGKGRVSVNGQPAKASRELRSGDLVELRQGNVPRAVVVRALTRGVPWWATRRRSRKPSRCRRPPP